MAQPVFDDHPLEDYFRQSGETAEPMPGGSSDFDLDPAIPEGAPNHLPPALENLPPLLVQAILCLNTLLTSSKFQSSSNAFAERFKYDVISSSLLSTSIASSQPTPLLPKRRPLTPDIPGQLPEDDSLIPLEIPTTGDSTPMPPGGDTLQSPSTSQSPGMTWPVSILSVAVLALSAEYYFLSLLLFALSAFLIRTAKAQASRTEAMNLTMKTLDELIVAGNSWDTVVNEAMSLIQKEEKRPNSFYGPTSPHSPFSPLRVALQSSLHTTQTQCDNVRHLLAALTSPTLLAQLSEMYAPASPVRPPFLQLDSSTSSSSSSGFSQQQQHPRPLSDPVALWRRRRTSSESGAGSGMSSKSSKRSTWNGSYLSLASQSGYHSPGSSPLILQSLSTPTSNFTTPSRIPIHSSTKLERRRSELSSLFTPPRGMVSSAPASPLPTRSLADVQEEGGDAESDVHAVPYQGEEDEEEENPGCDLPALKERGYFGMAALDVQRKRRSMGLDAFRLPAVPVSPLPPPRYTPASPTPTPRTSYPSRHGHHASGSGGSPAPTLSSSGRFTLPHLNRHPLSLSALELSLQGALASKRYASSHLLALRFDEEEGEDESYWEDVRSVMGLLVGALGDASGRLKDALSDSIKRSEKDSVVSPVHAGMLDKGVQPKPSLGGTSHNPLTITINPSSAFAKARSLQEMMSFAPVPSHLTRFAAHVDAIASALNDARSQLEECVAAIRDPPPSSSSSLSMPTSPTLTLDDLASSAATITPTPNNTTHNPNQNQNSFQRPGVGLGLEASAALQAYDRLRKELGMALRECERGRDRLIDLLNPPRPPNPEPEDLSDADIDEADRDSMATPPLVADCSSDSSSRIGSASIRGSLGLDLSVVETTGLGPDDDLLSGGKGLMMDDEVVVPIGVEQVYEGEPEIGGVFRRERSTMTREERIKLVKARRESLKGLLAGRSSALNSRFSPSDDVAPGGVAVGQGGERELRRVWEGEVVQELRGVIFKVQEQKKRRMSEEAGCNNLNLRSASDITGLTSMVTSSTTTDPAAASSLSSPMAMGFSLPALPPLIVPPPPALLSTSSALSSPMRKGPGEGFGPMEVQRSTRRSPPTLPSILDTFEPPEDED